MIWTFFQWFGLLSFVCGVSCGVLWILPDVQRVSRRKMGESGWSRFWLTKVRNFYIGARDPDEFEDDANLSTLTAYRYWNTAEEKRLIRGSVVQVPAWRWTLYHWFGR